jgi:DHA3 family tetracycline resistance protein-like MFS transporter
MFYKYRLNATRVYLFMEMASAIFLCLVFTTNSLYEVTVAGLAPLQLVLIGTALEVSAFLFEVPTGIVADAYSRRLSIVIGYLLIGLGLLVEGFFPAFWPILLSSVIWGLGYTFTSGAKQAWITDEIGEEAANKLFLRTARLSAYAGLFGLGVTLLLGANNTAIPIRVGALGVILTGFVLAVIMPETGFHPTPKQDRNTWQHMGHIFKQGMNVVKLNPRLINIVFVGLCYGLYSEGLDRLSTKLIVDNFQLPVFFGSTQLSFFVLLDVTGTILYIILMRFVEKRVDTSSPLAIGRAMLWVTGLIILGILGFSTSPGLPMAVIALLAVGQLRGIAGPLQAAWINQRLDSSVRATIHSMFGQVDAIGQVFGGPVVGLVANLASVRLAVGLSSLLLSPALLFIRRANGIQTSEVETHETISESIV